MRLGRPTVPLSAGTGHGDFEDLDSERLGTCRSWVRVATLRCAEPCIEKWFLTQMCARFSPSRSAAPWEEGADALVPANQRCSRLSLSRRPPARAPLLVEGLLGGSRSHRKVLRR